MTPEMTGPKPVEVATGLAVGLGLVLGLAFLFGGREMADDGRYPLVARFERVDGLETGADVRMAGIAVGTVSGLAPGGRRDAMVTLRIDRTVVLDNEGSAAIVTDSLFGGKVVELDIGGGDSRLRPGDEIQFTESALVLDDLLQLIVEQGRQARKAPAPVPESQ